MHKGRQFIYQISYGLYLGKVAEKSVIIKEKHLLNCPNLKQLFMSLREKGHNIVHRLKEPLGSQLRL